MPVSISFLITRRFSLSLPGANSHAVLDYLLSRHHLVKGMSREYSLSVRFYR